MNTGGGILDYNEQVLRLAGTISDGNGTTGLLQMADSRRRHHRAVRQPTPIPAERNVLNATLQVTNNTSVGQER